ncbi:MAG: hypothetical protein WDA16_14575 [Candidatus Thermoplasmatota archaeon]
MLVELLRLAAAVILLVLLPGYLLVQAAFPPVQARLGVAERAYLSVVGGVVVLILVGVTLGFLPHEQRGWFQTSATGAPNVEFVVLAVSTLLFYVGLQRGAYPAFERRFSWLVLPNGRSRSQS